ncbi:hypothetical protein MLD59_19135 [Verrucomicrobiaceae bacterium E54]|nr:hypothetical protein [Verrucomicrobiaceae bacterium E54]
MEDKNSDDRSAQYEKGSLSLTGAVSMGTGVMIGAGILALTGQIAGLAGELFPLAFVLAAFVWVKAGSDTLVVWASALGLALVFVGEKFFLRRVREE